jgi:hypothetical protein
MRTPNMKVFLGFERNSGKPAINIGEWKWESQGRVTPTDEELKRLMLDIAGYLKSKTTSPTLP